MSPSHELVLVTGASGYLGSHVAVELLQEGYSVRLVSRAAKSDALRDRHAKYGSRADVVVVEDLVTGDYSVALKGVNAVVHVASPLMGRFDGETTVKLAVQGTLNIVKQATEAGVKKFVVTSSSVSLQHPAQSLDNMTFGPDDWNLITEAEVAENANNPFFAYSGSKALAERALWAYAAEHPDLEVVTVIPPILLGPFAPGFTLKEGDTSALSTMGWLYQFVRGEQSRPWPELPAYPSVDVRDAARVHVLALRAPPTSKVGQKRFVVSAGSFSWKEAVEYLIEVRPELKSRLPSLSEVPEAATGRATFALDSTRAKEVLGIKLASWKTYALDGVDDLIRIQKEWAGKV